MLLLMMLIYMMLVVSGVARTGVAWLMVNIMTAWMVTGMLIKAMWRAVDRDKVMSAFFATTECRHRMIMMVSRVVILPMTLLFISCIVFFFATIESFFLWCIAFVVEAVPLIGMNYYCRRRWRIALGRMIRGVIRYAA